MNKHILGIYSAQAAALYGSVLYSGPASANGQPIEVTCVSPESRFNDSWKAYKWPDKIEAGPVLTYLGVGRIGSVKFESIPESNFR